MPPASADETFLGLQKAGRGDCPEFRVGQWAHEDYQGINQGSYGDSLGAGCLRVLSKS